MAHAATAAPHRRDSVSYLSGFCRADRATVIPEKTGRYRLLFFCRAKSPPRGGCATPYVSSLMSPPSENQPISRSHAVAAARVVGVLSGVICLHRSHGAIRVARCRRSAFVLWNRLTSRLTTLADAQRLPRELEGISLATARTASAPSMPRSAESPQRCGALARGPEKRA